jgi:hypothetical protein
VRNDWFWEYCFVFEKKNNNIKGIKDKT